MGTANISGNSTKCTIVSTVTFPYGFTVSHFADDIDPVRFSDLTVQGHTMLIDGRLLPHKTAKPIEVAIAVIPGSSSDANLGIILSAAQIKQKIIPIKDTVIMTISHPNGGVSVYGNGAIISGPPGKSIAANGRWSSNVYRFVFGSSLSIKG